MWPLKKDSVTFLWLLKLLKLKRNSTNALRLKVFNTKKGVHHFLTTLNVFNTEKGQHHCLKVFNTKKGLHRLGLLKFLTLKKDFITSLRLAKLLILKNDFIAFL